MEYIFIVNPKSGKRNQTEFLENYLREHYSHLKYSIYITKSVSDAIGFVKEKCESKTEPITFIACGGDGTVNEVVNGIFGYDDVYMTVYPCGSGNDFVKVFGDKEQFLNLNQLINGVSKKIDVLEVNGRYTVNMCNIGFDASVAYNMNKFRKWPLITGKGAYTLGIIYSLIFKMKHKCVVEIDDEIIFDGNVLLSAIGNGICCGGSYYCLPKASVEDGLIDAVIVRKISRIKFIKLISKYKSGEYLDDPKFDKYIKFKKCKKVKFVSEQELYYCLDGECKKTKTIEVNILHKAINFIVPTFE